MCISLLYTVFHTFLLRRTATSVHAVLDDLTSKVFEILMTNLLAIKHDTYRLFQVVTQKLRL